MKKLLLAIFLLLAGAAFGQNECIALSPTYVPDFYGMAKDSQFVLHQNLCIDPATGSIVATSKFNVTNATGSGGGTLPTPVAKGSALVSNGISQPPAYQTKAETDVRDLGMDCTGVVDSYSAWIAGVTPGSSLLFPQNCTLLIGTNLTIPSTVTIRFAQGAMFVPATLVTITDAGSVVAGPKQQIVNTTHGTVSFWGSPKISCGWYGSSQDLVHDDVPGCEAAHNANPGKFIYLTPLNPHCGSGVGGGCLTAGPDALFLSQLLLHANGSGFGFDGMAYHKVEDGGPWILAPNTLGTPTIFVGGSCGSCFLANFYLRGPTANAWNSVSLTTFELFTETGLDGLDNDGITVAGGHAKLIDVGAGHFLRHGIFLCGNNTCPDGTGAQAAVDYWYIDGCSTVANRGFGIFIVGGDGGGGKSINCGGLGNAFAAIGDWTGAGGGQNTHLVPGDETSGRDAILAGTTQAVSSVSVLGGTCTLTTTAALANGVGTVKTWVVVAGTAGGSGFDGTYKVTSVNSGAQQITYQCPSSGGPASGGTVRTASSREVFNYYATIYASNGITITPGYSYTTGNGQVLFIAPYSESAGVRWGSSSTVVIHGQNSQGFFNAGQLGSIITSGPNGFEVGLPATVGGSAFDIIGLQDSPLNLNLQNGITTDPDTNIFFYTHPASGTFGSANFQIGQWLSGRYFRFNAPGAIGSNNYFLLADKQTGDVSINGITSSGSIILQQNIGNGIVKFYCGGGVICTQAFASGLFSAKRLGTGFATTLTSADFTIGANWGNTAAIAMTDANSKDGAYVVTITANGTGIAANPTLQITFHDGTWTTTPVCQVSQTGGNDVLGVVTVTSRSATAYTYQWNSTPTAGKTYEFTETCIGTT